MSLAEEQLEHLRFLSQYEPIVKIRWLKESGKALRALLTEHKELTATVERQRKALDKAVTCLGSSGLVGECGLPQYNQSDYYGQDFRSEDYRAAIGVSEDQTTGKK